MKRIPEAAGKRPASGPAPVRRPVLARSQPIRNFSGVFGPPQPTGRRKARAGAATTPHSSAGRDGGAAEHARAGTAPKTGPADAVARGVNAGYRVIEEYLRQGQDFARSLWPGTSGTGGPASSTAAASAGAPINMAERLVRSASDLAGLFSEFLQTFSLPGTLPAPGSSPIPDFGLGGASSSSSQPAPRTARGDARRTGSAGGDDGAAPAATPPQAATTVSIDLRSRRRAEVTATMAPGAWHERLQVHDLRPLAATVSARLTGVAATAIAQDRRVVLTIDVPDALPAGTYSGLVVDAASNLPRGTLSVRIVDDGTSRRRKAPRPR